MKCSECGRYSAPVYNEEAVFHVCDYCLDKEVEFDTIIIAKLIEEVNYDYV